jgi:sugar phosphate isomerase/epimerase
VTNDELAFGICVRRAAAPRFGMSYVQAFSTLGCPDFTLEETLVLAERHGIEAVELRALGGSLELPVYLKKQYGTPAALAGKLRGSRVNILGLGTSLHVVGGRPGEREAFLGFVPWAEALGVRWLRIFDSDKILAADEFAQAVGTMQWWREQRAAAGWKVDVMIETHGGMTTTGTIQSFLAAVPGAAILWDTHHTWKKGGEDPLATWRAIWASVVHVHVKDSISVPSARHPYTFVLPGDGEFPMAPLAAVLRDEFAGAVSLEWEKAWHPSLPSLDEALRVAAARAWW